MQTTQVTVNLSLLFESLIEMMRSLELQEKIKLRDLLNQEITVSEEQNLDPAVKCFQRGWDDGMNGRTHPISELWDGIEVAEVRRIIEKT
jgi:hypothetical protein